MKQAFNKHSLSGMLIICLWMLALATRMTWAAPTDDFGILPLRERAGIENQWLQWRLEHLLPDIMNRYDIDTWVILNREYNEDPVYFSLVPEPAIHSYRTTLFVFHKHDGDVRRLSTGWFREFYQILPKEPDQTHMQALAGFLQQNNPQKIGINVSQTWHLADGLSATLKENLVETLPPEYSQRLVSAERLCLDWLATRSDQEIEEYRHLCRMGHQLIREFYSREVITPGVTSLDDVRWWIRQRICDLQLETWFQPILDIQRSPAAQKQTLEQRDIIQPGDLLHCDVGLVYLGLCTDMQWHAYVCRQDETDVPAGLKRALQRTVGFNDIIRAEFAPGKTGLEIGNAALAKGKEMGLNPTIYCHSLGTHGHAAGLRIDTRPVNQVAEENPARRTYPTVLNSVYAIEYCCHETIPEWDHQTIRISFEEDAVLTSEGCQFLDGHQEKFILIK